MATPDQLDELEAQIDRWAVGACATHEELVDVQRGEEEGRRWYLRLKGEEKQTFSVWFKLNQRTLYYETFVAPAPHHDPVKLYVYLMRRNMSIYGAAFGIGEEDALFLSGKLPVEQITDIELDRILGTLWEETERCFRAVLRLGFGVGE